MIRVDMHCDSVSEAYKSGRDLTCNFHQGHVDLPRLRQAGIKIQFFALFPERLYYPGRTLWQVLRLIDYAEETFQKDDQVVVIKNRQDLEDCLTTNSLGALLTVEGGNPWKGRSEFSESCSALECAVWD